jgi:hypothetical protein
MDAQPVSATAAKSSKYRIVVMPNFSELAPSALQQANGFSRFLK